MAADVCVLRSYISAGLLARCAQVSPWWDEPTAEQEEQEVRLLFSAAVEAKTALELSWFCADCGWRFLRMILPAYLPGPLGRCPPGGSEGVPAWPSLVPAVVLA